MVHNCMPEDCVTAVALNDMCHCHNTRHMLTPTLCMVSTAAVKHLHTHYHHTNSCQAMSAYDNYRECNQSSIKTWE